MQPKVLKINLIKVFGNIDMPSGNKQSIAKCDEQMPKVLHSTRHVMN